MGTNRGRHDLSAEARFWMNVHPEPNTGCWLWGGHECKGGYGALMVNGCTVGAHRFSYQLHHGPIPAGLWIRHKCDNPWCVNPDHLAPGTAGENVNDKVSRNRQARGKAIKISKLVEDQIRAIRLDPRSGPKIAADYGVHHSVIYSIRRRKTWKHVE